MLDIKKEITRKFTQEIMLERKYTKVVPWLCLGVRSLDDFFSTFLNFPSFL